jgi:hypothetical protein
MHVSIYKLDGEDAPYIPCEEKMTIVSNARNGIEQFSRPLLKWILAATRGND